MLKWRVGERTLRPRTRRLQLFFCEGLNGIAADSAGNVTLMRLADYIHQSMENWFKGRTIKQHAQFVCDIDGTVTLAQVSTVAEIVVTSEEEPSPLRSLGSFVERHVAGSPADVGLTEVVTAQGFEKSSNVVFDQLHEAWSKASIPGLKRTTTKGSFQTVCPAGWQACSNALRSRKFQNECANRGNGMKLTLEFGKAVLPNCSFCVGVVQFHFFYWIWFVAEYSEGNPPGWKPNPHVLTDYVTILPHAINDPLKVRSVIDGGLARFRNVFEDWSTGLGAYLEQKFGELRDHDVVT